MSAGEAHVILRDGLGQAPHLFQHHPPPHCVPHGLAQLRRRQAAAKQAQQDNTVDQNYEDNLDSDFVKVTNLNET